MYRMCQEKHGGKAGAKVIKPSKTRRNKGEKENKIDSDLERSGYKKAPRKEALQ